jgi:hypothetical protein
MGRAVGPSEFVGTMTLGVAQGWDGFGPLALGRSCPDRQMFQVESHTANLWQPMVDDSDSCPPAGV